MAKNTSSPEPIDEARVKLERGNSIHWLWLGSLAVVLIIAIITIISVNKPIAPPPTPIVIKTSVSPKDGMVLDFVPEGNFKMGYAGGIENSALPSHTVWLNNYWVDQTEVTNAMYQLCVDAHICKPAGCQAHPELNGNSQPVVCINWDEASQYCRWAGRRLPSEAEWEKAARGTDERMYPWGNEKPNEQLINIDGYDGKPDIVGRHPAGASPYGALDMAGNVWEWVSDWYEYEWREHIDYSSQPVWRNPLGPSTGDLKVIRGGVWTYGFNDQNVTAFIRSDTDPSSGDNYIGFRCVLSQSIQN